MYIRPNLIIFKSNHKNYAVKKALHELIVPIKEPRNYLACTEARNTDEKEIDNRSLYLPPCYHPGRQLSVDAWYKSRNDIITDTYIYCM